MALFKKPDNIVRRFDTTSVIADPNRTFFNNPIPLKYGQTMSECPLIYRQPYGQDYGPKKNGYISHYALSASFYNSDPNLHWASNTDFVDDLLIFGGLGGNESTLKVFSPDGRNFGITLDYSGTRLWNRGRTATNSAPLATWMQPNLGGYALKQYGSRLNSQGGTNLVYFTYLKAGDDITQTDFYRAFGPNGFVDAGFIEKIDNRYFDSLIVLKRGDNIKDRRMNAMDTATLRAKYFRSPVIPNGSGGITRTSAKMGNFLYEFFTNKDWGLNLPESRLERSDFVDVGNESAGTFQPSAYPLTTLLERIEIEANSKLLEQQGKVRFKPVVTLNKSITDDNIIGDIEIQFPDLTSNATQLIADYSSKEQGLVSLSYGDDPTRIEHVFIENATTLSQADAIASNLYQAFNFVTIKFKGDRSLYELILNDRLELSTSVFSGVITIVELELMDDFTVNITAESPVNNIVPKFRRVSGKPPIISRNGGYYRPKINERDFDIEYPIIAPPAPPVPTPPDVIEPPVRLLRTFAGLSHPYNFITGSENTNWYLGSTVDGLTIDDSYDSNGCRTRFYNNFNQYAYYSTDFSLIFRPANEEIPVGIKVAYDIALSPGERNANILGAANYRTLFRIHYPGFFSSENNTFRTRSTRVTDWQLGRSGWAESFPYKTIPSGSTDAFFENANDNLFVFQIGEERTPQLVRGLVTFDTVDTKYITNLPSSFGAQFASPEMRKTSGGVSFYRLHFAAIFGDISNPTRAEYIGSTSTFGDGRSILPADVAEARASARYFGINWAYSYVDPPSRSVS